MKEEADDDVTFSSPQIIQNYGLNEQTAFSKSLREGGGVKESRAIKLNQSINDSTVNRL